MVSSSIVTLTPAAGASGVATAVLVATLLAACAHAGWNSIAHGIGDKLVAFTLVGAGGLICAVPLAIIAGTPNARCWPWLAASVVLHMLYNVLLMRCYRLGDFGQVYPLARGTSPLAVTLLALALLGETPGMGQLGGVLLISTGLGSLVLWGRRRHPGRPAALFAAVATGIVIASYTTVDGVGVRLSGGAPRYTGWLMMLESAAVPIAAVALRRKRLWADLRPVWHVGLIGGVLSVFAYGLVLWAQTRGSLASVAALRESSIVLAAIVGTVVFHERFGAARIVATVCVLAGIATLYLG